jgi:C-methyltransferase C-terminal domain/Putative zinc binding domain
MTLRTQCRLCDGKLGPVILDLGFQPPSNFFTRQDPPFIEAKRYPLQLVQCAACTLLQLNYDVPTEQIFNARYPLHSSKGSAAWLDHAKQLAESVKYSVPKDGLVYEIGSNDGYLLRHLVEHCSVVGIDPTGIPADVPTYKTYFTSSLAMTLPRADAVIALNTVAQIPDLKDFVTGLALALNPGGFAVLEFPDIVKTIKGGQFDQIYHEHYSYLSVLALGAALRGLAGMHVAHVEHLPTHGGSLRVIVRQGYEQLAGPSVLRQLEREAGLNLQAFTHSAQLARSEFRHFLTSCDIAGMTVAAYGAAAKGNTFLNYIAQPPWAGKLPAMIGDVNPEKIGKLAPGTQIPVVSEEALLASKPDYILLLAWNWKEESIKRLRDKGYKGAFVVAVPQLEVID